jgi:hypothetical protein
LRIACGVSGIMPPNARDAHALRQLQSARARRTTRTLCTPPLTNSCRIFRSLADTSICRAGRAMPRGCAETFQIGIVCQEFFPAVLDPANPSLDRTRNPPPRTAHREGP